MKGYTKENTFSINRLCKLLGVSRMVYYRSQWSIRRSQCRASEVVDKVQELRMYMPRIGTRKSYHLLNKEMRNLGVGRDKMFDILRANHMLLEPKRSYHITTNSHHRFHKYKNIVENLDIRRPEQVWVADITYIGGRDKHCYLSLVTDAYSKKIVGFDLSNSLDTSSCIRALNMAKRNRTYPEEPLIHHSDRGIQYCSNQYQAALSRYSITPSMTESYDPYANAVAERVNGILKQEFFLEDINLSLPMMKHVVSDAIRTYNTMRPHLSCSYLTPEQMHHQSFVKLKKFKSKKISSPAS